MMKLVVALILVLSPLATQALSDVIVRGVVVSFDDKKIVLKNGPYKINVPRKSYPDLKKVSIGHTVIEVRMNPYQMMILNRQPATK